ncbi:hypothetical protein [Nonomuraea sp. SBT364]|uniref:hypothetical protein n=1 Tax=Nonomuraea sp. SBT364 TaxID=1580530 RepID=UPI00066CB799|nr:hypothetical protein [Nonomuraea sp. SBT364]
MDAMQVLAHRTAMGHASTLHEALPDAPVKSFTERRRVRVRLAYTLRVTADRLDPACPGMPVSRW